jgi:hypothetical protein
VQEAPVAVLLQSDASEPVLHCEHGQQVDLVAAHSDVNSAAGRMWTNASRWLPYLGGMRMIAVSACDFDAPPVCRAQALQAIHERRIHLVAPGVLAVELRGAEVGLLGPVHDANVVHLKENEGRKSEAPRTPKGRKEKKKPP